jgi:hypothetical protein
MDLGHHHFWWHWRDAGLEGLSMNREDIEQWTREAGGFDATPEFLKHFAKLVAKHEREACAKIADTAEPYKSADLIRARGQA